MPKDTIQSTDYPTVEELETILNWKIKSHKDCNDLLDYVLPLFERHGFVKKTKRRYYISTGGWSGCEEIIHEIKQNYLFWALCWISTTRGGHYIFERRIK